MKRLIVLLALLTFAACETDTESSNATSDRDGIAPQPSDTTVRAAADDADGPSASPGISLQSLLDSVGEGDANGQLVVLDEMNDPGRVEVNTQQNRHDPGQVDTVRTRHYDGMSVTVYHVSGGKEIIQSITVSSGDYETARGLRVGMSRTEIETSMGEPMERQDESYVYELEGALPLHLNVEFEGDAVSQLHWDFPVD